MGFSLRLNTKVKAEVKQYVKKKNYSKLSTMPSTQNKIMYCLHRGWNATLGRSIL